MTQIQNTIKVSIIVPIYKVEAFIEECLESIFNQTYDNIEVILVNDCSPDRSKDIINKYIEVHKILPSKYKYIEHKGNKGLGAARLTGITESTGDYIFHIDSDDWIEKNTIELLVAKSFERNSDLVVANMILDFPNYSVKRATPLIVDKINYIKKIILRNRNYPWNQVNTLIKRDIALKALPIEGINMGEDWITFPRLLWFSDNIANVEEYTYHYRQVNNSSYTNNLSLKSYQDLLEGGNFLFEFFNKKASSIFNTKFLNLAFGKLKYSILLSNSKDIRKKVNIDIRINNYNAMDYSLSENIMLFLDKYKLWNIMNLYVNLGINLKKLLKYISSK